jgi:hypothetical protein
MKERFEILLVIAKRAEAMGINVGGRLTLLMDLENADNEFTLRLEELLSAENSDFTHDIVGIQRHINRETGKIENFFVPRFAS